MVPPFPNIPQPDATKLPEAERADCQHLAGNLKENAMKQMKIALQRSAKSIDQKSG
jgi:hypothetical protein